MIGSKSFDIGAKEFIEAMTSNDNLFDGGFSNRSVGINSYVSPGVLSFASLVADISANLAGAMLGSCEDAALLGEDKLFLSRSSNGDGKYYTYSSGTGLTLKRTDSTNDYIFGASDIAFYQGSAFGTSDQAVAKWTVDSLFNASYYSFSSTGVPHPELVYQDYIYYGDRNLLLRQSGASGAPATILTLPSSQTITALGIDPGSGNMLIATTTAQNISDTRTVPARVQYYDGFSNKVLKTVIVDDTVNAFFPTGGTVYLSYGQSLGYWNGAGIQFVRNLGLSFDNTALAYRNHFSNIGTTLYVIEGRKVMAFGEVIRGRAPVPRYIYRDITHDLSLITNLGQNKLAIAGSTSISAATGNVLYALDTSSTATLGTADFYSLRYNFPRPVTFSSVTIEYASAMPTDGNPIGAVQIIDSQGNSTTIAQPTNTVANQFEVDCPWQSLTTRMIQLNYTPQQATPIRRFTVFYVPYD